jgi:hypothetical protein
MNWMWIVLTLFLTVPQEQDQPTEKKPTALEESIAVALRNHPDIRIAEAEVQVAQAKLAQAKLLITQRITAAHAELAVARADAERATQQLDYMRKMVQKNVGSQAALQEAETKLQQFRAAVAAKEAMLKSLTGSPDDERRFEGTSFSYGTLKLTPRVANSHLAFDVKVALPQSVTDKLKAALDTPVLMDKQQGVELEVFMTELLKKANVDLKVRLPATENKHLARNVTKLDLDAGDHQLRVWLQLVLDETNNYRNMNLYLQPTGDKKPMRYELYLREYGLLLSTPELAPPEAITLQQFYRQLQAERKAKEQPKK